MNETRKTKAQLLSELHELRQRLAELEPAPTPPTGDAAGPAHHRAGSERDELAAALRTSEAKYRALVEQIPAVTYTAALDATSTTTYVSPQVEQFLGLTQAEYQEDPDQWVKALHPDDRERVLAEVARCHATGEPLACEYRMVSRDGRIVWFRDVATLVRDEQGRARLLQGVMFDITERHRSEEERARLTEQLHEARKMQAVGEVAAGIAHDFGNLLAAMQRSITRLQHDPPRDEETRQSLAALEQAVEEAGGVAQSLLMFSQRLPSERKLVALCKLVQEAEPILRHLLPAGVSLRVATNRHEFCWVNADRAQLQQVLLNLVINARDAMPAGGTLHISVRPGGAEAPGPADTVRLTVSDTGQGIPDDVLPRIFEPFFTTKPVGRGVGLGLATVRSIVQDHGGHVEVDSRPGAGTTFTVTLPVVGPAVATERQAEPAHAPAGRGAVVLLDEENRHIRRLITAALRSWDYQVLIPPEGRPACEAYRQAATPVALLILSADPPERAGLACLRRIRAAGHLTPVILTLRSADPEVGDLLDPRTAVLHKPFQLSELGARLGELLAGPAGAGAAP